MHVTFAGGIGGCEPPDVWVLRIELCVSVSFSRDCGAVSLLLNLPS